MQNVLFMHILHEQLHMQSCHMVRLQLCCSMLGTE